MDPLVFVEFTDLTNRPLYLRVDRIVAVRATDLQPDSTAVVTDTDAFVVAGDADAALDCIVRAFQAGDGRL